MNGINQAYQFTWKLIEKRKSAQDTEMEQNKNWKISS